MVTPPYPVALIPLLGYLKVSEVLRFRQLSKGFQTLILEHWRCIHILIDGALLRAIDRGPLRPFLLRILARSQASLRSLIYDIEGPNVPNLGSSDHAVPIEIRSGEVCLAAVAERTNLIDRRISSGSDFSRRLSVKDLLSLLSASRETLEFVDLRSGVGTESVLPGEMHSGIANGVEACWSWPRLQRFSLSSHGHEWFLELGNLERRFPKLDSLRAPAVAWATNLLHHEGLSRRIMDSSDTSDMPNTLSLLQDAKITDWHVSRQLGLLGCMVLHPLLCAFESISRRRVRVTVDICAPRIPIAIAGAIVPYLRLVSVERPELFRRQSIWLTTNGIGKLQPLRLGALVGLLLGTERVPRPVVIGQLRLAASQWLSEHIDNNSARLRNRDWDLSADQCTYLAELVHSNRLKPIKS